MAENGPFPASSVPAASTGEPAPPATAELQPCPWWRLRRRHRWVGGKQYGWDGTPFSMSPIFGEREWLPMRQAPAVPLRLAGWRVGHDQDGCAMTDEPMTTAATILYERTGGQWVWRCDGCWLGTGHPSYTEARKEAQRHIANGHDLAGITSEPARSVRRD